MANHRFKSSDHVGEYRHQHAPRSYLALDAMTRKAGLAPMKDRRAGRGGSKANLLLSIELDLETVPDDEVPSEFFAGKQCQACGSHYVNMKTGECWTCAEAHAETLEAKAYYADRR